MNKANRKTKFLLENLAFKSIFETSSIETLQENEKTAMSAEVAKKIYEIAVQKLPKIDFGDIPKTKGDVTKFIHYSTMQDAIEVLESSVGTTPEIATVKLALKNLEANSRGFVKAYMDNIQVLQYLYCLTVLACLQATSLLIASYVTFIKAPSGDYTYQIAVTDTKKNKTMEATCLDSLNTFNQVCLEGGINKMAFESSNFLGMSAGAAVATSMVITFLLLIVPVMRELIYQFYYMRTTIADFIDAQVSLIELSHTNGNVAKDAKGKQQKIAKRLQALSEKIRVEKKIGEDKARKDIKTEKIDKDSVEVDPMGGFGI